MMDRNCPECGIQMRRVSPRILHVDCEMNRLQSVREYFELVNEALKQNCVYWICPVDGTVILHTFSPEHDSKLRSGGPGGTSSA